MMPEKPRPKSAETANSPISSCVSVNATTARNCHIDPISTVISPPMRSEIHPQAWRLKNAVPSSTDSIAAPCEGRMPKSVHSATRWPCGIDIGTQQQ